MSTQTVDQSKLKDSAPEDGSRRYKKGLFQPYDTEYHRLASKSVILNDNAKAGLENAFAKAGIGNCKRSLIELNGNDNGKYKEDGSWKTGLIPAARENLKEVYRDFKRWQVQQIKGGFAIEAPEEWPDGLLVERLKGEARLDVRRAEKFLLESRIEQLKKERGKSDPDVPVLPLGPIGIDTDKDTSRQWYLNGQKVSVSTRGIPFIDCPDSPYDRMPVANYREMVKEWRQEIGIDEQPFDLMGLRKRRDELFEKAKKEAIKNGEQPPVVPQSVTNKKLDIWFRRLDITEDDWPSWPNDAKPIDELEKSTVA